MSIFNISATANPTRSDMSGRPARVGDMFTVYIKDLTTSHMAPTTSAGDTNELILQCMPPEIQDQKSANWTPTSILGRSEPIQGYGDSAPRSITLNLSFVESLHSGDKGGSGNPMPGFMGPPVAIDGSHDNTYVQESVHFLQSLVYPNYDFERIKPPPTCLLVVGTWLIMRFITKDVSVTWKAPWSVPNLTPMLADVSLTIEEVNYIPWGHTEVRMGTNSGLNQPSSLGGGRLTTR